MPSRGDLKTLLVSLFPAGSEQLYDLDNGANIGGILYSLAGALKDTATDRVDELRLQVNPSTMVDPSGWEQACGLSNTVLAKFGTTEQRRNAVLSVLREHSSFSLDDIRAAVQPYFLYADPSQIEIVETDRAALTALHTYVGSTLSVGANASGSASITIPDDGFIYAGDNVLITVTGYLDEVTFSLNTIAGGLWSWPRGYLGTGSVTAQAFTLRTGPYFTFLSPQPCTLTVTTGPSGGATVQWSVFVEMLGRPSSLFTWQGLGAAMFEFGVVADPALLGAGYDLDGAYRAIQKVKPAHTIGNLIFKNVMGGLCPIPDDPPTIPDRVIPC